MIAVLVLTGALAAIPQVMAAGAVYRWVDKDGSVHYGDRIPDGVEGSLINVRPNTAQLVSPEKNKVPESAAGTAAEAAAREGEAPELSIAEQRRQDRAENRRKNAEEARKIAAKCEIMRVQKARVEPSPRVLVYDENGEVRRLDDNERVDMLNEANAYLAKNCTQ